MESFAVVAGAVASALAVAGALRAGWYGWRQRQLRAQLASYLSRLFRIDRRLVAWAVDVDRFLSDGVGWHGIAIDPPILRGHVTYLWGQIDELERDRAMVRALDTSGATERLRATVEEAMALLRRACGIYLEGSLNAYRDAGGSPFPPGATGRDPLAALGEDGSELLDLRPQMELAVRTAAHQLDREHIAEGYQCRWPVYRWEVEALAVHDLWSSEPQPLRHDRPGGQR